MTLMADIRVKRKLFSKTVEGTEKRGEDSCTIRARTVAFSGYWQYDVKLDTPGETFNASGHFLLILQAMKQSPLAREWLDLLKEVAGTVSDRYGSATAFFTDEQMLCIAALKKREMSIEELAALHSLKPGAVHQSLVRLASLDLVYRDDFSDPEIGKKKYMLTRYGELVHGVLLEDSKFSGMQAMVDSKMGERKMA